MTGAGAAVAANNLRIVCEQNPTLCAELLPFLAIGTIALYVGLAWLIIAMWRDGMFR